MTGYHFIPGIFLSCKNYSGFDKLRKSIAVIFSVAFFYPRENSFVPSYDRRKTAEYGVAFFKRRD